MPSKMVTFTFMTTIIETKRITIREFIPDELDTYLNHFVGEDLLRYIPKRTLEERTSIFKTALSKYPESKATGIWGIFSKTDGTFIGSCLLRPFDDQLAVLELGYSIEQNLWSKGFASEMAAAMVTHAFANESITEVVALTSLPNVASQRVLDKAGLKRAFNLTRNDEELACFRFPR